MAHDKIGAREKQLRQMREDNLKRKGPPTTSIAEIGAAIKATAERVAAKPRKAKKKKGPKK